MLDADFFAIALPRFVQGLGLGLCFVPLAASTYVNIPKEKMGNASGIFNLIRNLGGSFSVAAATTLLSQRSQLHQTLLAENIIPFNPALREYTQHLVSKKRCMEPFIDNHARSWWESRFPWIPAPPPKTCEGDN